MTEKLPRKRVDKLRSFRCLKTNQIVQRYRGGPGLELINNNEINNSENIINDDDDNLDARQRGFINRAREAAYGAQQDSLAGVRVTHQMYEMAEISSTAWRLIADRLKEKRNG